MGLRGAAAGAATITAVMAGAALAGTVFSTVVAQIPAPASDWAGLVGQLGIGGILVWYLYFTTSVLLPRIHAEHQESVTNVIDRFREDLRLERDQSQAMHRDLRDLLSKLGQRPCLLEMDDPSEEVEA